MVQTSRRYVSACMLMTRNSFGMTVSTIAAKPPIYTYIYIYIYAPFSPFLRLFIGTITWSRHQDRTAPRASRYRSAQFVIYEIHCIHRVGKSIDRPARRRLEVGHFQICRLARGDQRRRGGGPERKDDTIQRDYFVAAKQATFLARATRRDAT